MPWNKRAGRLEYSLNAIILLILPGLFLNAQNAGSPVPSATPANSSQLAAEPSPAQATPVIMIDAAHGGTESGAVLGPDNLEKEVTLVFARRLKQDLISRGLQAQLVRDGDTLISTDQRASIANASNAALYVCVHATSQGSGVRIYTAMPGASADRGPFLSWQTAQAQALPRSRLLQQQMTAAIQKTRFPIRSLSAPLRPLSNLLAPAIAIEISPVTGKVSQLATADYQQMISAILANAIAGIRGRLESGQ